MIIKAKTDKTVFLMSNEEKSNCLGLRIEMIDDVDGEMLQKAVDLTMTRYSYLKVRLVEKRIPYYVENPAPCKVQHVKNLPELGGPDTDFHLLAFAYYGKTITIYFFHGMLDGTGIFTIARTLIHYYAKFRYDSGLSAEGVITLETPVNPDEMEDGYFLAKTLPSPAKEKRRTEKTKGRTEKKKTGKVFLMSDSALISPGDSCHKLFHIRIQAEEMMEICRGNEISPSLLVSLLLAESIRKLHPEAEDISGGLCINARRCMNNIGTLRMLVVVSKLKFTREISRLPFDVQCTICRGKVLLDTENDNLFASVLEMAKMLSVLEKVPYSKTTKKFMHKVFARITDDTFQVSYTGQSSFGAAEKYVNSVLIDNDMPANCINVEMTAVGDSIFISFGQKWKETCYLDAFLEELNGHDIHTEIIEEKLADVPALYSVFY